jgi:manganese transport protein
MMKLAIAATDLAKLIGSATALLLLFGIPIWAGVLITCGDVLVLLAYTSRNMRMLELLIFVLVAFIAACFTVQLTAVQPDWGSVFQGYIPRPALITDAKLLYNGVGILGKLVM